MNSQSFDSNLDKKNFRWNKMDAEYLGIFKRIISLLTSYLTFLNVDTTYAQTDIQNKE